MILKKIAIPKYSVKLLERKQLWELFDNNTYPVLVLQQPSGFGKTAVVSQYASQTKKKKLLWYSLDYLDNKIDIFLSYLYMLLLEKEIPLYENKEKQDTFFFMEQMSKLIEQLEQKRKKEIEQNYLVFDNFEWIENQTIVLLMKQFIENLPGNLQLIIITNQTIPSFFYRYKIEHRCCFITNSQLKWSFLEMTEWSSYHSITISKEEQKCIYEFFDGFPVGIINILEKLNESLKKTRITKIMLEDLIKEYYITNYLDNEVIGKIKEREIIDFLIHTSIFPSFTKESCIEILKLTKIELLDQIIKMGLFLQTDGTKYWYSPFFSSYLKEKCDLREQKRIYSLAANYYKKKKDSFSMIEYAYKGKDYSLLNIIVKQFGKTMLQKGKYDLLGKMITCLEEGEIEVDSETFGLFGQYYYAVGQYDKMETMLNLADSMFGKENQYSIYRIFYRSILQLSEQKEKYMRWLNHALFFLKENQIEIPFLLEEDKKLLTLTKENYKQEKKTHKKQLKIQFFGGFYVETIEDGKEFTWRTKKGKELFAYLVSLNGKPVERRQLLCVLWREEIPDNAVAMLHNMIYNIRKELSAYQLEELICYKNRKYFLETDWLESDLVQIDKICTMVEQKKETEIVQWENSFQNYWGAYLEDIDAGWVSEKESYYEKIYIKGCEILADHFIKQKKYEKAIGFYKNILQLDCYSEEVMEQLINCYRLLGDRKSIKKQYEKFQKLLKADLDVLPGEKLQSVYKQNMQS